MCLAEKFSPLQKFFLGSTNIFHVDFQQFLLSSILPLCSFSTTSTTKVVKVHLQMNQSFMARATEKSLLRHVNNHD